MEKSLRDLLGISMKSTTSTQARPIGNLFSTLEDTRLVNIVGLEEQAYRVEEKLSGHQCMGACNVVTNQEAFSRPPLV